MALLFENKVSTNQTLFISEVKRYASLLGIPADWLMAIMYFESRLNHTAYNATSGAYGLIQFMPATITGEFGITVAKMKSLSNVQQLYYVYIYLKKYKSRLTNFVDVYLAVFFPAAMAKGASYVIQTSSLSASTIANQNPIFDTNNDNKITVGELQTYLLSWIKSKGGVLPSTR